MSWPINGYNSMLITLHIFCQDYTFVFRAVATEGGGSGGVTPPPPPLAMPMVVISGKLPSKNQVNYELIFVSCQRKISWITQEKIASEFEIKLYL